MAEFGSRVLLPFWRSETGSVNNKFQIPDYGNSGVTVETKDGLIIVQNGKNTMHPLAAKMVSLPFLPPNREGFAVNSSSELCALNNARWKKKIAHYQRLLNKDIKTKEELREIFKNMVLEKQQMFEVPKNVYSLACEIPKGMNSEGNNMDGVMHNGGGICYQRLSNEDTNGLVIHCSGKNMEKMVIVPVDCSASDGHDPILTADPNRQVVREFNSKIYQVETKKTGGRIFSGLRFRNKMELGILSVNKNGEATPEFLKTALETVQITHFTLSPYIPGDYLYITSSGEYTSCNMETTCTTCRTPLRLGGGLPGLRNWSLQYSAHPRCFVCCCESDIILKDLRIGRQTSSLLNNNIGLLYPDEKLCTMKRGQSSYLHYIGTTRSLILLDERYPGHPVHHWNHQMTSPPRLISCANYSTKLFDCDEAIVLASRNAQDVVLFNVQHQDATRCCSLSPPLHISKPSDFIDNLLLTNMSVDPTIRARTEFPLDGLVCIPTESRGLTVLQLTAVGDVFYQDFYDSSGEKPTEIGHRSGPGYVATELEPEVVQRISTWIDDAFSSMMENTSSVINSGSQIDATDLFKAMTSLKPHTHGCPLCCFCDESQRITSDGSQVCSSCGTIIDFSCKVTETAKQMGVLAGPLPTQNGTVPPISLPVSLNGIQDTDDVLMQRMATEWLADGELVIPDNTSENAGPTNSQDQAAASSSGILVNSKTQSYNNVPSISIDNPDPIKVYPNANQICDQDNYTGLATYFLEISQDNEPPPVYTIDS